jgi:alkylation response protein AidB-like acyl-CoA dehydrogenase
MATQDNLPILDFRRLDGRSGAIGLPSAESVAAASVAVAVAVAEVKIASSEAASLVASRLIKLGGSSATLARHGCDRCRRNARTHTVRWKYRAVGDYRLNGINPPRRGAI